MNPCCSALKSIRVLPVAAAEGFLENADLLLRVVELPRHPWVDRVRDHREDELERRRQHRGPNTPHARPSLQAYRPRQRSEHRNVSDYPVVT
jgi:hypothetical protein